MSCGRTDPDLTVRRRTLAYHSISYTPVPTRPQRLYFIQKDVLPLSSAAVAFGWGLQIMEGLSCLIAWQEGKNIMCLPALQPTCHASLTRAGQASLALYAISIGLSTHFPPRCEITEIICVTSRQCTYTCQLYLFVWSCLQSSPVPFQARAVCSLPCAAVPAGEGSPWCARGSSHGRNALQRRAGGLETRFTSELVLTTVKSS